MSFRAGLPLICLFFALSLFDGVSNPLVPLLAVLIHEGGHILAAWLTDAPLTAFSIGLHGLSLSFDFSALSYGKECFILLAGSGAGLLTGLLLAGTHPYFAAVSAAMAFVNLFPVRGLDGGAAISCILNRFFLPHHAARASDIVSRIFTIIFWVGVVWIQLRVRPNLSLLAASFYLLRKNMGKPKK